MSRKADQSGKRRTHALFPQLSLNGSLKHLQEARYADDRMNALFLKSIDDCFWFQGAKINYAGTTVKGGQKTARLLEQVRQWQQ